MALKPERRKKEKVKKKGGGGVVGGLGGPKLSSARPWWDLCRGARYTAFRRGGRAVRRKGAVFFSC